ncbi:dihydrofolate reductase [Bacteroidetes bacterium endosymbiont of Geopemphigus sp.]|uniref:dihydrofolate reductase n=1 Tax=Bacteroidetes bacterium endosymbiont of Geopemphigus sp. TaxID=2047937 RepID=UPI000CD0BA78|nr:dihydrofolate reductase [Bacteroidetes bacterium endosymbiont of Geopemphigus sp.]
MKRILIAAVAENGIIGDKNRLIWHLPDDLKRFKKLTFSQAVIMGRKTFESLGKALAGRENIIISKNPEYSTENARIVSSLQKAFEKALSFDVEKAFIIGGAQIYALSLNLCDELNITRVHADFVGDALFPEINERYWEKISEEYHPCNKQHPQAFSYINYRKKFNTSINRQW